MDVKTLNLLVFFIALSSFTLIGLWGRIRIKSPRSYFHSSEVSSNVLSLLAANVTLGSGFVYLISTGFQFGLLMLVVPLMTGAGYFLLAWFVRRVIPSRVIVGRNFLKGIDNRICELGGSPPRFAASVSLCLILVFVLFLSFEIFASASILTPLLFESPGPAETVGISGLVFLVTLIYSVVGGITGVFRTDKLQLVSIVAFIAVLYIIAFRGDPNIGGLALQHGLDRTIVNSNVTIAAITASLAAISTQFYSIVNWTSVSHVQAEHQSRVLRLVGIMSAIILILIMSLGVFFPAVESGDPVGYLLATCGDLGSSFGFVGYAVIGLVIVGLTSIIFSTADSIIIAATLFFYENLLNRDSFAESDAPTEIRRIRFIALGCFGASFVILTFFNFAQPNVFYLLLTIASGVIVFAPMLATAAYLSRDNRLLVISKRVVGAYVTLFLIAFLVGIVAMFRSPQITPWIGAGAFSLSVLVSMFLVIVSKKRVREIGHTEA